MSELPQVPAPRCVNLCSKALVVFGESFEDDPDFQAGMDQTWCAVTLNGLGPDNGEVTWEDCRQPGRSCFREY